MSSLFGKSSRSSETNVNRDAINRAFSGPMGATGDSISSLQALLGGDPSGFNAFKQATGFDAMADRGARGILGSGASRGLLRSGSSGMALQGYGQELQNQFAQNYMQQLLGTGQLGLGAGELVAGAGRESRGRTKDKSGLGKAFGEVGVGLALSDRRLKKDIKHIGRTDEGLNVYEFKYTSGEGPFVGVMAQEVAELKPEALGPLTEDGYMTVDYNKIDPNFYYKVS